MSYRDIALDFYRTGGDHSPRGTPSVVKIRPEYRVERWVQGQKEWAERVSAKEAANAPRVAAMRVEERRIRKAMGAEGTRRLVDMHIDRIKVLREEER